MRKSDHILLLIAIVAAGFGFIVSASAPEVTAICYIAAWVWGGGTLLYWLMTKIPPFRTTDYGRTQSKVANEQHTGPTKAQEAIKRHITKNYFSSFVRRGRWQGR